jgi:Na+-driven multidrug efflux pump
MYFIEATYMLGPRTTILGVLVHYLVQITFQVVVLYLRSPTGCYKLPNLSEVIQGNSEMLSFLLQFCFAILFELISYFMVPLIFLLGINSEINIGIWSIISQTIGLAFYIGYSVSAYTRSLGNQFLAKGLFSQLKSLIVRTSLYLLIFMLVIMFGFLFFAESLSALFFHTEGISIRMTHCFRLIAFFLISEAFMVYLNSALRMIGFVDYTFKVNSAIFLLLFPIALIYCTWKLHTEAPTAVILIGISNTSVCLLYIGRLVKDFGVNCRKRYNEIDQENKEHLLMNEIELV